MSRTSFTKAVKSRVAPKLAIMGASGCGKTYSALRFARGFVGPTGRIALIDTENRSAELYDDVFDFDVSSIAPKQFEDGSKAFWHTDFRDAIDEAISLGYDILIVDSASHLWRGILAYKSRVDEGGGNGYANWKKPGDAYQSIVDKILQAPIPVVCCFRSKMAYVLEEDENGKNRPVKVGLAPIARDDTEYEFTTMFDVDRAHLATAVKDRTRLFRETETITEETGKRFRNWLDGARDVAGGRPAPPRESGISAPVGRSCDNVQLREENEVEASADAEFDPSKWTDDRPSNGLESLDEILPEDVRSRAVAFGRDPAAVDATARRKFGVGLDDLSPDDLRYVYENLRPKGSLAVAVGH